MNQLRFDDLQPSRDPKIDDTAVGGAGVHPADPPPTNNDERQALLDRFSARLVVRPELTRRVVSYQGNRTHPGLRWLHYKEAFTATLVRTALIDSDGPVLDPFAGAGTSIFVAGGVGREATGIEIMPVGVRAAQAMALVAGGVGAAEIDPLARRLLVAVDDGSADDDCRFPHVTITDRAFSADTEQSIAAARTFLRTVDDEALRTILDVACMSVLEEVSYTRKDGQYLRWDMRSGRDLRGNTHKGHIPSFRSALERRLGEIIGDAPQVADLYSGAPMRFIHGSALDELAKLPNDSFGLVVTSPPYANRYDYTRTYALELAWLGYDQAAFRSLRQSLLSATVENISKADALAAAYGDSEVFRRASEAVQGQRALHEALAVLRAAQDEIGNPSVIRLLDLYVSEMAVVISELARVVRPGGHVVMVNDNVQYHGEEIPMDLILSDVAEQCGFVCDEISVLPRGKGNASQQMRRFGRRELRKSVYRWHRPS